MSKELDNTYRDVLMGDGKLWSEKVPIYLYTLLCLRYG